MINSQLNIIKAITLSTFFLFLTVEPFGSTLSAQHKSSLKKKKTSKKENEYKLMDHLWFGGGFTLQFASQSLGNGVPGNLFYAGISPLAGYKVTKWLSFGPRLEYTYIGGRFDGGSDIWKLSTSNYSFGVFNRMKFLNVLFSHLEYTKSRETFLTGFIDANNRLITAAEWRDHLYAGLGYNAGVVLGYEFYVLYDFLAPEESVNLPIIFRIGLTYKF